MARLSDITAVLRAHTPSITREIEQELMDRCANTARSEYMVDSEPTDTADCALRICSCGVRIDGYYEFIDHLVAVVDDAWTRGLVEQLKAGV